MRPIVILATRSGHKAREIRDIVAPASSIELRSLDDQNIPEDPAEQDVERFETFLENAHAKAEYFLRITGRPTIADDSGISVDWLNGAPGVRSRRFASAPGLEGAELDHANNAALLEALRDAPEDRRSAHYTCAAVLHLPDGRRFAALGTCSGFILREPRGTGGFGYDPLFLIPAEHRTFGQMSDREKHRFSHRARAFRALASVIDRRSPFR